MRISSLRRMGGVKRNPSKSLQHDTSNDDRLPVRLRLVRCGNNQMMGYASLHPSYENRMEAYFYLHIITTLTMGLLQSNSKLDSKKIRRNHDAHQQ